MAPEILVVDDEADIRDLTGGILEDEGYSIRSAANSEEALSRRQFLRVGGAGISAVALGAWGLSRLFGKGAAEEIQAVDNSAFTADDPFGASLTSGPAASPSPDVLAARPAAVRGTRPELTPTDD